MEKVNIHLGKLRGMKYLKWREECDTKKSNENEQIISSVNTRSKKITQIIGRNSLL